MIFWILFTKVVFGSPLPQTFIAKHRIAGKPHDGWFPFLVPLISTRARLFSAALAGLIAGASIFVGVRRRVPAPAAVAAAAAFATLGPYAWFNPVERMAWYYTLPEVMFLISMVLLPALLRSRLAVALALGAILAVASARFGLAARAVREAQLYTDRVEPERMEAGRQLRALSRPGERVIAGHGHVARESHRYVIDYSGLNSRVVTEHGGDLSWLIGQLAPTALATGWLPDAELQARHHLRLERSFYGSTIYGYEPLRIYRIGAAETTVAEPLRAPLDPGTSVSLPVSGPGEVQAVFFGVARSAGARSLSIEVNGQAEICPVPAEEPGCLGGCTAECGFRAPRGQPISEVSIRADAPFTLLAPVAVRAVAAPR